MNLAVIYEEIQKRLAVIDFSKLWRGFFPLKFAVYTDTECYFDGHSIEKTDAFCANTAIPWQDSYIAIWHLEAEPTDLDILSSKIVHEMFHAFQSISKESRFADEMRAPFQYQYASQNLSGKLQEAAYIRAILEGNDQNAYDFLLRLRKVREERYPYEYAYESKIEQIEGCANFVELAALSCLAPEKARQEWKNILARISDPQNYFPIRPICYETGVAVLLCIRKCSKMDYEAFGDLPFSQEMISGVITGNISIPPNAAMDECRNCYLAKTHEIIGAALQNNDCVLRGDYPLVSVNIADARCEGSYLTSTYFVMYRDGEACKTLNGNFVLEMDADYHIRAIYRQLPA